MQANDLEVLLRSRVPIIVVDSRDEAPGSQGSGARLCADGPAASRVGTGASRARRAGEGAGRGLPLFRWTVTDGLKRLDIELGPPQRTVSEPLEILRHIRATTLAGVYALLDFHPYLHDPTIVRLLKDIAQDYGACAAHAGAHQLRDRDPARARVAERRAWCWHCPIATSGARWSRRWRASGCGPTRRQPVKIDARALELLVENMSGLSAADTQRLARSAIFDHGAIQASDVPAVMRAKYELLNHGGVLRYEHDTRATQRRRRARQFQGLAAEALCRVRRLGAGARSAPRAYCCSACRAVARAWPRAPAPASSTSRCCGSIARRCSTSTWVSPSATCASRWHPPTCWRRACCGSTRSRKGFAAGDSDGGATRRVLGAFLTWLAEKSSRVFVVATANDISALPPELIRKGRFDEIFFVDLPAAVTRAEILRIHAAKRGIAARCRGPRRRWRMRCEGFSGAEIEQAIVAALYSRTCARTARWMRSCCAAEIAATRPLAVVMAENVAALRAWAKERTVPAD